MGVPIAVDFDSTLTTGEGEPWWDEPLDEQPNEEMIQLTNDLYHRGHTIIIYTARLEDVRRETRYFLDKWGVKYHALEMEKLGYAALIDDRAIHPEDALYWDVNGIEEDFIYD